MGKPMYKEKYVKSSGSGMLHVSIWEPKEQPIGILQIVHGIAEHTRRYDEFANFLTEKGLLVVAEDHMGHGQSLTEQESRGYFYGGWFAAVEDTYQLLQDTKNAYPDIPYILFGHSMGSFMVRTILEKYPDSGINGCIICGTGWQPSAMLLAGVGLCKFVCKTNGEQNPSEFLHKVIFGAYNRRVEQPRTAFDWLTRVEDIVDAYAEDPMCGFIPSAGLLRDMLTGIAYIQNKENLQMMKKDLPVFLVAGDDDPVGAYGSGVHKTAEMFVRAGMENVTVRLYSQCRHEILNEINREEIMIDLWNWIDLLLNQTE